MLRSMLQQMTEAF